MNSTTHPPQIDAVGHIETRGVDFIPNEERHSSPMNIFWILIGANLTFGLVVIGWLPISFGLNWWGACSSILVGNAVGALILAPVALIGPRTGTNGPVGSGAYFGVVGRILGSAIGMLLTVGFYSLSVWTGGQAAVAGMHRLFDLPDNATTLAISYIAIAFFSSLIAIYGHASMVLVERLMLPIAGLVMLVGIFGYVPMFDAAYAGGNLLLGSFWPTWLLSVTITAVAVYGYAPLVSDWTRYISPTRYSSGSIFAATWIGGFIGLSLPFLFGAFTAVAIASTKLDYVHGLVAAAPSWYLLPLIIVGTVGSLGQGAVCLYSCGLDLSSIIPGLKRPVATVVLSVLTVIVVLLGTMVASAEHSVTGFLQILGVATGSWVAIITVGHFRRGGRYDVHDLQVFNRGETGGVYWYTNGWNFRAVFAFVASTLFGLLALRCALYAGPFADVAQGVDISWASAFLLGGALYWLLVTIFPEHQGVNVDTAKSERAELVAQSATV